MEEYIVQPKNIFREPQRYEIHEGVKIYYMAGTFLPHARVVVNLISIFQHYLRRKKCQVFGENVNVVFDQGKREYMPDVKIVCDPNKIINDKKIVGAPDLVAEVLSPGTETDDIGYKKDIYEQYGVKEYWIVSTETRSIQVYLLKDGRYKLENVYRFYRSGEYEDLEDEQKSSVKTEFKTSLFEDLIISVEDVFENVN
ncbi:MAG: Uma2 family endonuclease [Oscillospiraceae bacterium]|nr:Uma2 family endonuclease [Oscillospiraceae bacterium]